MSLLLSLRVILRRRLEIFAACTALALAPVTMIVALARLAPGIAPFTVYVISIEGLAGVNHVIRTESTPLTFAPWAMTALLAFSAPAITLLGSHIIPVVRRTTCSRGWRWR